MNSLSVGHFVWYLKNIDCTWRPEDYKARVIVKSIKNEHFKGYADFKVGGRKVRIDYDNSDELVSIVGKALGKKISELDTPAKFHIVPIPNSDMFVGAKGPFRVHELAKRVTAKAPTGATCVPALRWREPKESAHAGGGTRDIEKLEALLVLEERPDGPVILLDDVLTTGSHMAAATRFLRKNGITVLSGVVVARATDDQHDKILEWCVEDVDCRTAPEKIQSLFKRIRS